MNGRHEGAQVGPGRLRVRAPGGQPERGDHPRRRRARGRPGRVPVLRPQVLQGAQPLRSNRRGSALARLGGPYAREEQADVLRKRRLREEDLLRAVAGDRGARPYAEQNTKTSELRFRALLVEGSAERLELAKA